MTKTIERKYKPLSKSPEVNELNVRTEFRTQTIDTTANKIWEALAQRDNSLNLESPKPLQAYTRSGEFKPVTDLREKFLQESTAVIHEATAAVPEGELQFMTQIVPKLASALVLDSRHIKQMYEQDLVSVTKAAVDMYMHPDLIPYTTLVVAYGGSPDVGSRVPAYIVSRLQIMEGVRNTFGSYGNWALHHELFERLETQVEYTEDEMEMQRRVDELQRTRNNLDNWVRAQIEKAAGVQTTADETTEETDLRTWENRDYLEEILSPKYTTFEQVRPILIAAWKRFGQTLDMEQLKQKYHFTDEIPTLVILNGANAAIEISGMDKEKVLSSRDTTQRLLKAYIDRFHPKLAGSVLFQNDLPPSQYDYNTVMQTLYGITLIQASADGIAAEQKTAKFAEHHLSIDRKHASPLPPQFSNLPTHVLYNALHRGFFGDPYLGRPWYEVMPPTNVMQRLPFVPRGIIWGQGDAELAFGVGRKIIAEEANLSQYIRWLETRATEAKYDWATIAQTISQQAISEYQSSEGKKDFRACLGKAMGANTTPETKKAFSAFLGSEAFREAAGDPAKIALWQAFVDGLKNQQPSEPIEQIQDLIRQLAVYQNNIRKLTEKSSLAVGSGHADKIAEVVTDGHTAYVASTQYRLEQGVTAGSNTAVYYRLEGVDSDITKGETPKLEDYNRPLSEALQRQRRLTGTMAVTKKLLQGTIPVCSESTPEDGTQQLLALQNQWAEEDAQLSKEFQSAITGLSGKPNSNNRLDALRQKQITRLTARAEALASLSMPAPIVDPNLTAAWINEDSKAFDVLLRQVDDMEVEGGSLDAIKEAIVNRTKSLYEARLTTLQHLTGKSIDDLAQLAGKSIGRAFVKAQGDLGRNLRIDVNRMEAAKTDLTIILEDIVHTRRLGSVDTRTLAVATDEYAALILNVFSQHQSSNGHTHVSDLTPLVTSSETYLDSVYRNGHQSKNGSAL